MHRGVSNKVCVLHPKLQAWLAEGRREKVAAAVSAAPPPPPPCAQRLLDGAAAAGEAAAGGAAAGEAAAGEAAAGGGGELSWEDGGEEVTVRVTLPAGTKSRDVRLAPEDARSSPAFSV